MMTEQSPRIDIDEMNHQVLLWKNGNIGVRIDISELTAKECVLLVQSTIDWAVERYCLPKELHVYTFQGLDRTKENVESKELFIIMGVLSQYDINNPTSLLKDTYNITGTYGCCVEFDKLNDAIVFAKKISAYPCKCSFLYKGDNGKYFMTMFTDDSRISILLADFGEEVYFPTYENTTLVIRNEEAIPALQSL